MGFSFRNINKSINCDVFLDCLCLWKNEYAFVGCDNHLIKLVNLKSGNIVKELTGHNLYLMDIKKITHPKYGECLVSQGYHDDRSNKIMGDKKLIFNRKLLNILKKL